MCPLAFLIRAQPGPAFISVIRVSITLYHDVAADADAPVAPSISTLTACLPTDK
jgi:hypothetical protein